MPWALAAILGLALFFYARGAIVSPNVRAFLALIRQAEANGRYDVIAGGDTFNDYSEHPFIVNPARRRPLGTTASGAYQMVRETWKEARDALGLKDFTPGSQDQAARFLIDRRGALELVQAGQFDDAIAILGGEWESFAKMVQGTYHLTLDDARAFIESHGGIYA